MKRPFSVTLRRYEVLGGVLWLGVYALLLSHGLRLLLEALGRGGDGILLNKVYYLAGFLGTVLLFHRFLADSLKPLTERPGQVFKGVLLGFCLYEFCQIGLSMVYEALWPDLTIPNDENLRALAASDFRLIAAASVLLAPITEETLLRGLVFGGLRERNRLAAYALSALVFAAVHVIGYATELDPVSLIGNLGLYLLPGAALCVCYEFSGTVWGPILLHAVINGIGVWALGLE